MRFDSEELDADSQTGASVEQSLKQQFKVVTLAVAKLSLVWPDKKIQITWSKLNDDT